MRLLSPRMRGPLRRRRGIVDSRWSWPRGARRARDRAGEWRRRPSAIPPRDTGAGHVRGLGAAPLPASVRVVTITQLAAAQAAGSRGATRSRHGRGRSRPRPHRDHPRRRPTSLGDRSRPGPSALAPTPPDGSGSWIRAHATSVSIDPRAPTGRSPRSRSALDPAAIAIGGGFAWVADARSNDVRKIDLADPPAVGSRRSRPAAPAVRARSRMTPSGTVWVANRDSSDVTAIRAGRARRPALRCGRPVRSRRAPALGSGPPQRDRPPRRGRAACGFGRWRCTRAA